MVRKIAVTLDQRAAADLDLARAREKRTRLARELAKLNPTEEKQMAEQGLGGCASPEY
jgi:hypothetical protein